MKTQKPLILIVEDDDDIRYCVIDLLQLEGYEVLSASNGDEALNLISMGAEPDVLLTDIMMPVMDGFELIERISIIEHLKDLSIICFTASTTLRERIGKTCKVIRKPFDMSEIISTIEDCINSKEAA